MKTHTSYLWLNTKKQKEIVNITDVGERRAEAAAKGACLPAGRNRPAMRVTRFALLFAHHFRLPHYASP